MNYVLLHLHFCNVYAMGHSGEAGWQQARAWLSKSQENQWIENARMIIQ
jgi:hypothetical protein